LLIAELLLVLALLDPAVEVLLFARAFVGGVRIPGAGV
jgi:hypothetical protein